MRRMAWPCISPAPYDYSGAARTASNGFSPFRPRLERTRRARLSVTARTGQSLEHRQFRFRDSARCLRSWCAREAIGPPGGCQCPGRSVRPWFAEVNAYRKLLARADNPAALNSKRMGASPTARSMTAWRLELAVYRHVHIFGPVQLSGLIG